MFNRVITPLIRLQVYSRILQLAFGQFGHPVKAWRSLTILRRRYRLIHNKTHWPKLKRVGTKYFWNLHAPAVPSPALDGVILRGLKSMTDPRQSAGIPTLVFAITSKCPLQCQHCFEWPNLRQPEPLSVHDLIQITRNFQAFGVGQIFFSGGEPLVRFEDLCQVLGTIDTLASDCWVISSGYRLDAEKALRLRALGLRGVMISLDHHEEAAHDRFRGYKGSFQAAKKAIQMAHEAGLVTALSLCLRPDYHKPPQIEAYLDLARKWEVAFVEWFEAKAVGRYAEQPVGLTSLQLGKLEQVYFQHNQGAAHRSSPIISYPDLIRRKKGCKGGGKGYLYVDTYGQVKPCPFCQGAGLCVLDHSIPELLQALSGTCSGKLLRNQAPVHFPG